MISGSKMVAAIQHERQGYVHELQTDYVKGIRRGLEIAAMLVEAEHLRAKRLQETSPFIWKASTMRRMIVQAIAYFKRADRAKGIHLLETVIQRGSPTSETEKD